MSQPFSISAFSRSAFSAFSLSRSLRPFRFFSFLSFKRDEKIAGSDSARVSEKSSSTTSSFSNERSSSGARGYGHRSEFASKGTKGRCRGAEVEPGAGDGVAAPFAGAFPFPLAFGVAVRCCWNSGRDVGGSFMPPAGGRGVTSPGTRREPLTAPTSASDSDEGPCGAAKVGTPLPGFAPERALYPWGSPSDVWSPSLNSLSPSYLR